MQLSIVTTLYYSEPYLREFYERMTRTAAQITKDYEILFVNDGSPDESLTIARDLCETDEHVRVVDLSRNFGHHRAIMTGLEHARGDLIFLTDSDLEEDPEWLERFYAAYQDSDADVVYGLQRRRKGGRLEQFSGAVFYKVMDVLSSYPIPANDTCARLMSRRYVNALIRHQEREAFLGGLFAITGFQQHPLVVDKHSKKKSTYTLTHKVGLFVRALTSFSNKPLILVFYLGCFIFFLSSIAACVLIARKVLYGFLPGWASTVVSIWLLGGLTILCIGVIGIYLSSIFMEAKQRPNTVIRQIYEHSPKPRSKKKASGGSRSGGKKAKKAKKAQPPR